MPQSTFEAASRNTGFLNAVAAVYSADGECNEAEDFLNRSLNADRAASRQPAVNTRLQLADIWVREGNYSKARQAYREIITRNQNSAEAWRGYITALHGEQDDRNVLSEMERMPAPVHAQLEKEANFLILLAGAHSELRHGRKQSSYCNRRGHSTSHKTKHRPQSSMYNLPGRS